MFKFKKSPEKNEAEQELLNNRLKALQGSGDISKVNEPINLNSYDTLKDEYSKLTKKLTDTQSLVELNKSLAIIAVRAGKNEDALKYLLDMRTADRLSTDKFILELEPSAILELEPSAAKLSAEYTKTKKNEQSDSNEQPPKYLQLYHYLQTTVRTKVAAHLKNKKYTEAYNETMYLRENGSNLKVFKLYLSCIEKNKSWKSLQDKADAYIKAFNEFKLKISSSKIPEGSEIVADVYKCLQTALQNISDKIVFNKSTESTESANYILKNNCNILAAEAGTLAEQYTPKQKQEEAQEEVQVSSTVTLTKKEKIAQKKVEEGEEALKQAQQEYINRVAKAEKIKNAKQVKDERLANIKKAEDARLAATKKANEEAAAKQAAEDAKIDAQAKIKLDAMQALVKKDDTSLTASDSSKESAVETSDSSNVVAASDSSNVVAASDSSNVAAVSNFSKGYVSIYPPLDDVVAEIAAINAKASSSTNVHNSSPTAAVIPTPRTADDDKAAADKIAADKVAAELLKTTILENVKEFITSSKTDTMKQIRVDCDNAIKKGINVYETVNDVKTLEVLASGFLSLNNQEKAEEICGKIATISPEAYRGIGDNKVLSLLAKKYSELELYNSCIESCKKLRATSEENYQLLKTIAEKTTDTDIQLAALTAAKSKTDNLKQQAELFLSKGKILLSLGKKEQASHEFGEAAAYNHDIYKDVAEETLKSLYESGNHEVGYWYLSKIHNFSHKDPSIANKLVEFSRYVNSVHGVQGEAACFIKAYLCAPNAAALVKVQNDLFTMTSIPYAADYYKNYCAVRDTGQQIETYLQGIVPVIDEHM
ncbi:MAG: hypothetical protein LN563_03115 [Rickettsia endosymbiont of Platyusa sonomae]|nr:hypothetical protein [Rickettsia endosymbiont of Platyusa sonomae]